MKELFPGIYRITDSLATKNLVPGVKVYGERLKAVGNTEYRLWNPKRSKLSAALYLGLAALPIKPDSCVLYLGASAGTTPSHISDMLTDGIIYALEFSPRIFRELLGVCQKRENMIPILGDANNPSEYLFLLEKVDVIYQDIAQANQTEILVKNADMFLKTGGHIIYAVKARSIDVSKQPNKVFNEQARILKDSGFKIIEIIDISKYEKDHTMIIGQKK